MEGKQSPPLLGSEITFLKNVRNPKNFKTVTLKEALQAIKNETYAQLVAPLEMMLLMGDDEGYKQGKSELPSYCYNGTFIDKLANVNFVQSSGLVLIDIDGLGIDDLVEANGILTNDSHVVFTHKSVSGCGIKAAIRVNPFIIKDDASFKNAFNQIEHYLLNKGLEIDTSGKDIRRVSFIGADKNLYFNKNASVFPIEASFSKPIAKTITKPITNDVSVIEIDGLNFKEDESSDAYSPITLEDGNIPLHNITLENAATYLPTEYDLSYSQWLQVGAALHHQFEGSDGGLVLFDTWSQNIQGYKDFDDCESKWRSFGKRSGGSVITFRSLIAQYNKKHEKLAAASDVDASIKATKLLSDCDDYRQLSNVAPKLWKLANKNVTLEMDFLEALRSKYSDLNNGKVMSRADALRALKMKPTKLITETTDITVRLSQTEDGKYPATIDNVYAAVSSSQFCGIKIGFDAFTDSLMIRQGDNGWEQFNDVHYTNLKLVLAGKDFLDVSTERIREIVYKVGHDNEFDSAQDWLNALSWDGIPRVSVFMKDYLGVEDTPYATAVSNYMWTAMAGRIIQPGCKADMVPVMKGGQGTFKSTAVKALVPDEILYTDFSFTEHEDSIARKFRGVIVAEIGELKGLNSKDEEHIKAFIVKTHEKWTPKYKEYTTTYPRRVIMFGTTNQEQFLYDPTGNRRWLPFEAGNINTVNIIRDRNQLWAEGAFMYRDQGISFSLAETLAKDEHAKYELVDDWEEAIGRWLESASSIEDIDLDAGITTLEILAGALHIEARFAGQQNKRRVGSVMKALGYVNLQCYRAKTKGWFWHLEKQKELTVEDLA